MKKDLTKITITISGNIDPEVIEKLTANLANITIETIKVATDAYVIDECAMCPNKKDTCVADECSEYASDEPKYVKLTKEEK